MSGRTKGREDRLNPLPHIDETAGFGQINDAAFLIAQSALQSPQTLGQNDGPQLLARFFEHVVDQHIIVLVIFRDLAAGSQQAALDDRLGIFISISQTPLQFLAIGRKHEDADGIRQVLFDLGCTLHVDVEKKIVTAASSFAQELARCPVAVSMHVGVFKKLTPRDHLVEDFFIDEVILLSVFLAAARRTRRVGDRENEVGNEFEELIGQGRLPRSRWSRDNEDQRLCG